MQLGKAIVGAIVGAVIGVVLMFVLYQTTALATVWLALLVALFTGVGVRIAGATSGGASYLRGAVTAILALAAYSVGCGIIAGYAQTQAAKAATPSIIEQAAEPAVEEQGEEAQTEAPADAAAPPAQMKAQAQPRPQGSGKPVAAMAQGLSIYDYIVLCISALIAYELGRGSASKTASAGKEPATPAGVHPDA